MLPRDAAVTSLREGRPVDATDLPRVIAASSRRSRASAPGSWKVTTPSVHRTPLQPAPAPLQLMCRTNDPQILCSTTDALTTALRHAHAGRPGRVVLPGVDHLLHEVEHPDTIAPSVLAGLRRFARH
ncbi:hypothetical protein [Streptomyces otsuchiensis]|uniref:hypothetical protein n=1 Tax=Streptomyces otsuchiensis TaxID=2681388 RepID=UPI001583303A|nr:hypothetical protein [Streptomyces otsuchiensis]